MKNKDNPIYQEAIIDALGVFDSTLNEIHEQSAGMEKLGFDGAAAKMRFGQDMLAHVKDVISRELQLVAIPQGDGE